MGGRMKWRNNVPCTLFNPQAREDRIKTPLHPAAAHRHVCYVIASGCTDAKGRMYEVHYCHCGAPYRYVFPNTVTYG